MILAGDLGGTKTDFAYFEASSPNTPIHPTTFDSRAYSGLESIAKEYVQSTPPPAPLKAAAFGVAGPIKAQRAHITNLDWTIDAAELRDTLKVHSVTLINDLEAIGYAIPSLPAKDLHTLQTGTPADRGALAIVAPGTGLGEAMAFWDGRAYLPVPSEGGHTDFAPTDEKQNRLLQFLLRQFDHVSYERVCSGTAIPDLYRFTSMENQQTPPTQFQQRLDQATDPTRLIVEAGLSNPPDNSAPHQALNLFVDILAAEAGNLALKALARGGVYLSGGLSPKLLPLIDRPRFREIFTAKGRFKDLMRTLPLHVVTQPKVGLLGAAARAQRDLEDA